MAFKDDLANGIISLVLGIAITWLTVSGDDHDTSDLLVAVAISSFFSGYFTSYFAK